MVFHIQQSCSQSKFLKMFFTARIQKNVNPLVLMRAIYDKRSVLISPIEKGGLKMPDLDSKIAAQTIICIEKYLAPTVASYKFILKSYLKKVGEKFLFQCNFDYSKLNF